MNATRSEAQPGNTFAWSITFLPQDGDVPALFVDDSTHQALIGANAAVTVEERVQGNAIRGYFAPQLCLFEGEVGMANVLNVFYPLEFEAGFVYVSPR